MDELKTATDLVKIGAAAWASKEVAGKLLGPTFDYIGGEIRHFAEKCNVNITGIFARAKRKLGERLEESGAVSPRVLRHVIDEGAFCNEAIAAEYVAGVLAAARVEGGRDDRGVAYLAVIRELSVFQLRVHYLVYWSIKKLLNEHDLSVAIGYQAKQMRIFLSDKFIAANLEVGTIDKTEVIVSHSLTGLARLDLIDARWWGGPAEMLRESVEPTILEGGYVVTPTMFGVELFLWAHGLPDTHIADFLRKDVFIGSLPDVPVAGLPKHAPDTSATRQREQQEIDEFVQRTIAERQRDR